MKISEILNHVRERITGFLTTITNDHRYIHKGIGFSLPGLSDSVAAGGTYKVAFKTPKNIAENGDQRFIHWRPADFGGTATGVTAELYEGSSGISGTEAVPVNRNRNSQRKSKMQQVLVGATVTEGTRIGILNNGTASAGASNQGGSGGSEHEFVLVPDTIYSITFTNRSGSTATLISHELFWYEEDEYNGN